MKFYRLFLLLSVTAACKLNVNLTADKETVDKAGQIVDKTLDALDKSNDELEPNTPDPVVIGELPEGACKIKTTISGNVEKVVGVTGLFKLFYKGSSAEAVGVRCKGRYLAFNNRTPDPWTGLRNGTYVSCLMSVTIRSLPQKGIEGSFYTASDVIKANCFSSNEPGSSSGSTSTGGSDTTGTSTGGGSGSTSTTGGSTPLTCQSLKSEYDSIFSQIKNRRYPCKVASECKRLLGINGCGIAAVSGAQDSARTRLSELSSLLSSKGCTNSLPMCMLAPHWIGCDHGSCKVHMGNP